MKIKCKLCEHVFDREILLLGADECMRIHNRGHDRGLISQLWAVTQAVANDKGGTMAIKNLARKTIITRCQLVDGIFECID